MCRGSSSLNVSLSCVNLCVDLVGRSVRVGRKVLLHKARAPRITAIHLYVSVRMLGCALKAEIKNMKYIQLSITTDK